MREIQPSPTLALAAKVRRLRAQGVDVVALNAGEPDFNTPTAVCDAAKSALDRGFTKYTPSSGLPELKDAICHKLWRENGIQARPSQIVVTCGAKHAIYNAMMALLEPGDEVLLLAPYWPTYADQARLVGAKPVVVHTSPEQGFAPSYDQLREAVTRRTRMIVLNSPCNPTGAMLPRGALKEIAALAIRHDLWVLTDEIYERLVYGEPHVSLATLGEEIAARTVTVNGCSKTYAMTGWRIGYAFAPEEVAVAMSNIQDQVTSNAVSFAQMGAIAALELPPGEVEAMRGEYRARRDLLIQGLRAIPGVEVHEPEGAFYAFPDVTAFLGGQAPDDVALAARLLDEAHVAVVPGAPFEGPGRLRISYAASREEIVRGVARIGQALAELCP
jgi:aspartate aminotransferase